ncbi:MAG: ribosome biogenesis GTP-binding protein YihA/YsxC [Casimicrobiaceae bacterium]
MSIFSNATYLHTAANLAQLPPEGPPEIAFAGRSNAGKSSAINALAGRRRLAFFSKTPGRTQQINFFTLQGGGLLTDLPGYGYAKVPLAIRDQWEGFLSTYLQTRQSLIGLALMMDARHPLTDLDWRMVEWFVPTGKPVHILLTKSDKLSRGPAQMTLAKVRRDLAESPRTTVQLFSSTTGAGLDEAERVFGGWLGEHRLALPANA